MVVVAVVVEKEEVVEEGGVVEDEEEVIVWPDFASPDCCSCGASHGLLIVHRTASVCTGFCIPVHVCSSWWLCVRAHSDLAPFFFCLSASLLAYVYNPLAHPPSRPSSFPVLQLFLTR
jgi:hypothetical protein